MLQILKKLKIDRADQREKLKELKESFLKSFYVTKEWVEN